MPAVVRKCIQCYESKLTRHGNMMVGPSLSGKSTAWKVLIKAMTSLKQQGKQQPDGNDFQTVKHIVINPKAVPAANLYGEYDLQTFEWTDGVLSKVTMPNPNPNPNPNPSPNPNPNPNPDPNLNPSPNPNLKLNPGQEEDEEEDEEELGLGPDKLGRRRRAWWDED